MNGEERHQLEAALSRSQAGLSALTETIPALILIHQGGRCLCANAATETILGYPRAEIFKRQATNRGFKVEQPVMDHILSKYRVEHRQMKGCEPRDLLDRATDICRFESHSLELTTQILDVAWRNYFGTSHTFAPVATQEKMIERTLADPLEL